MTRLMGLILAALAVEVMADGLGKLFPILARASGADRAVPNRGRAFSALALRCGRRDLVVPKRARSSRATAQNGAQCRRACAKSNRDHAAQVEQQGFNARHGASPRSLQVDDPRRDRAPSTISSPIEIGSLKRRGPALPGLTYSTPPRGSTSGGANGRNTTCTPAAAGSMSSRAGRAARRCRRRPPPAVRLRHAVGPGGAVVVAAHRGQRRDRRQRVEDVAARRCRRRARCGRSPAGRPAPRAAAARACRRSGRCGMPLTAALQRA